MTRYFTVLPFISLINLGLLVPTLAVCVRRLHDTNRSGWWLIMPYVVAIIGVIAFFVVLGTSIVQMAAGGQTPSEAQSLQLGLRVLGSLLLFVGLPSLIAWVVMLVFFVTDGTAGKNRFGDDPKGRGISVF